VLAFYLAAAEVINETHGRTILPVGAPAPAGVHKPA
jgi:succinate-acetate transporter protein